MLDQHTQAAKAFAISRISRSPGFRELLELLDEFAEQSRSEAFNCADDSRAVRLLHEGRGATTLVNKFKQQIALIQESAMENPIA